MGASTGGVLTGALARDPPNTLPNMPKGSIKPRAQPPSCVHNRVQGFEYRVPLKHCGSMSSKLNGKNIVYKHRI